MKALAEAHQLTVPVMAIGAGGGRFTLNTFSLVAAVEVRSSIFEGVGHYVTLRER
jgi:hypothetical protein